jgi:cytochrome c5
MKKIIYISLIGLSTACGTKSAEISSKPQQEPKVVEQEKIDSRPMAAFPNGEIAEGSSLYTNNCAKCHDLPEIPRYSKEKWQKIVPSMAREAKLDNLQESKIMAYVNWKLQQQ